MDLKSGEFFRQVRRSRLWIGYEAIHRSALTKARKKIGWQIFRDILNQAVKLAYELWPSHDKFYWHGMNVFGIDGSKYALPASQEIREEFDPKSGLQYKGKGHYPMCLVSTAYDVLRHLPIARTVVPVDSSEREEVKELIPFVPDKSLLLFDRGYPSFEMIHYLIEHFKGHFVFRCPSESTFSSVMKFVKSGKKQDIIRITPTNNYLKKTSVKKRVKYIKLRVIKLKAHDGRVSVLLTSLLDYNEFPLDEIITLYFKRWKVETHYRSEKVCLEIESFHSKTCNGIRQELFAVIIMSVISRTLMQLSSQSFLNNSHELQFKNSTMMLASEAAVLTPDQPEKSIKIFYELLNDISKFKSNPTKTYRKSEPRFTKRNNNKWIIIRASAMRDANA